MPGHKNDNDTPLCVKHHMCTKHHHSQRMWTQHDDDVAMRLKGSRIIGHRNDDVIKINHMRKAAPNTIGQDDDDMTHRPKMMTMMMMMTTE